MFVDRRSASGNGRARAAREAQGEQHYASLDNDHRTWRRIDGCESLFFHRQGEFRDRTFENQLSGIGLDPCDSRDRSLEHHLSRPRGPAFAHARRCRLRQPPRHVAPLGWEHIALTGDYVWSTGFLQAAA